MGYSSVSNTRWFCQLTFKQHMPTWPRVGPITTIYLMRGGTRYDDLLKDRRFIGLIGWNQSEQQNVNRAKCTSRILPLDVFCSLSANNGTWKWRFLGLLQSLIGPVMSDYKIHGSPHWKKTKKRKPNTNTPLQITQTQVQPTTTVTPVY